jgi:hypothetical protein
MKYKWVLFYYDADDIVNFAGVFDDQKSLEAWGKEHPLFISGRTKNYHVAYTEYYPTNEAKP